MQHTRKIKNLANNLDNNQHNWQEQLKNTVNNIEDLCKILELDYSKLTTNAINHNYPFPIRVPKYYLNKIKKKDYQDPLLLQIIPNNINNNINNNISFTDDPLEEYKYTKAPGLIHKYHNRVLLTITSACGIHCRYCFRQNFPYNNNIISNKNRSVQLDYINNNTDINEIILSGGDPLCVNNNYLDNLLSQIIAIKHIDTIRFHSRMPIVIPDRIDYDFIKILQKYNINNKINFILVTHCNHPNELDEHIKSKIKSIKSEINNVLILNQAVLLKNINNNPSTLVSLSKKLFDCNIQPYYLHLLDPVTGSERFYINKKAAKKLHNEISSRLSGYLVPKLVQELSGYQHKVIV